jgi:hypothetical protein
VGAFDPDATDPDAAMAVIQTLEHLKQITAVEEVAATRAQGELTSLNVGQLRQRAASVGVDAAAIELARDSDAPKAAIIALIEAVPPPAVRAAELQAMTVGQLRQRASKSGVDAAAVEIARDSDDPKAAIIALIVAKAQ